MTETQTHQCTKCGEFKKSEDFDRDASRPLGRRSSCKPCRAAHQREYRKRKPEIHRAQFLRRILRNPERYKEIRRAAGKKYYRTHKEVQNDRRRRQKLGVPIGTYAAKLAEQGGGCAICGKIPGNRAHHLDHCHETGEVRGVLCPSCNRGIGAMRDDVELLQAAIDYLRRHKQDVDQCRSVQAA